MPMVQKVGKFEYVPGPFDKTTGTRRFFFVRRA